MTISSTTQYVRYAGNGATTSFSFQSYFLAETDLKVYVDDNLQTLNTHYTVAGVGEQSGGTVTFVTAPAGGTVILISREPTLTQGLDLVDNDALPAEQVEKAIDRLTMISQWLASRFDRSLLAPLGETVSALPSLASRANGGSGSILGFDASGNPVLLSPQSGEGTVSTQLPITSNTVPRFAGSDGTIIKGSGLIISDTDDLFVPGQIWATDKIFVGGSSIATQLELQETLTGNGLNQQNQVIINRVDTLTPGVGVWHNQVVIQTALQSGHNGNRAPLTTIVDVTGAPGDAAQYVAIDCKAILQSGSGFVFGGGSYAISKSGVDVGSEVVGWEFDVSVASPVARKVGIQIVDLADSVGSGIGIDAGILVDSQPGGVGFKYGLDIQRRGILNSGGVPIRIPNDTYINARNADDDGDIPLIGIRSDGAGIFFEDGRVGTIFAGGKISPSSSGAYDLGDLGTNEWNNIIARAIKLAGSTSGSLTIKPAAIAGTNTLTFPAGTTDFSATGPGVLKQASAGAALTVGAANLASANDVTGILGSSNGGTGVNNGDRTLTVGTNSGTVAFSALSKTLTVANSLTLSGTDGASIAFGAGGTVAYTLAPKFTTNTTDGAAVSVNGDPTNNVSRLNFYRNDGSTLSGHLRVRGDFAELDIGGAYQVQLVNNGTFIPVGGVSLGGSSNFWAGSFTDKMTMREISAPSAPASDQAVVYLQDNGAGKTQLMVRFSSGAAQQIAIQP